jgi:EAL domain-containing protein (putative c-di-GMP-specific phosphodiesterase class I)
VTRLLQKGVDEARHLAYLNRLYQEARDKQRLQHFILKEDVRTVFQPIVDLESHNVHGFEALARGPRQTDLESPLALFDMASKSDLLFELDQVCRYNSVKRAESLKSPHKLFINTLPFSIRDPHFRGKFLLDLLDGSKLVPERIVLEVTETLAIEDYTAYLEEMRYFSDMGFLTAIDDMGAGHSGLEKVVQLRPDYLKLDMHMVRGIDASPVKQDIMRAFCTMAKDIGTAVVAEGVETRAELETVQELGADYVQGYYLARPAEGFQTTLNDEF